MFAHSSNRRTAAPAHWGGEDRYRALLEQTPAIVYRTSFAEGSGEFYVNPQIEKVLGFSQQEWEEGPRLWLNQLHPQDRMRVLGELAHCHDSGESLSTEYRILSRDGQIVWFRDEALIARNDDGHPIALQGVRMDITERRRAEEALRRNLEERLAAEETLLQRNRQLELLHRAAQALGSTLDLEDVLSTVLEEVRNLLGVAASSIWLIDPNTGELVCQQAAGSRSDALRGWRLSPGQGIAGWVVYNDESLIVGDVRSDERHFRGVSRQTGLEMRSILAAPMRAKRGVIGVLQVLDTDVERFDAAELVLLESLTASATSAVENARLYEQAQQEIGERIRAEEELRQERTGLARRVAERTAELSAANAELARAARLKDEFLAAMSHELRTPLNAILGLSETLEEQVYGEVNERQLRALTNIRDSGRHLLELINDILDVAKIEAGKLDLQPGRVPVEPICRSSLMLVKQMAHQKQLDVSFEMDGAVTSVVADGRRLKQILVNLLTNACKFTPEGGKVGLKVIGDAEGEAVRFVVWDTGIGISEEHMERLFRPFVQLDSSLSRQYEGTGLGLALVRRLSELHGGGVSLESKVGEGSRFTVSLPWQAVVPARRAEDSGTVSTAPQVEPVPGLGRERPGRRPVVLVADDNEANIATVQDYLEVNGYRVIVARNGVEAIARTREEVPDLVLMDIQMPELDGLEATRRIRADAVRSVAEVPIIALTALAMPGDRERCLEAGANLYLSKPVSLRGLAEAIQAQQLEREQGDAQSTGG